MAAFTVADLPISLSRTLRQTKLSRIVICPSMPLLPGYPIHTGSIRSPGSLSSHSSKHFVVRHKSYHVLIRKPFLLLSGIHQRFFTYTARLFIESTSESRRKNTEPGTDNTVSGSAPFQHWKNSIRQELNPSEGS